MPDQDIAATILRRLRVLTWMTVVLAFAVLAVGGFAVGYAVNATARADNANDALCASKADYQNRVKQTEDFIQKHPSGALGFTPAQIAVQLRNQRRTVEALGSLECDSHGHR